MTEYNAKAIKRIDAARNDVEVLSILEEVCGCGREHTIVLYAALDKVARLATQAAYQRAPA